MARTAGAQVDAVHGNAWVDSVPRCPNIYLSMADDPTCERDSDAMERRPLQHAAGGLAAAAFVMVTQILSGGFELDRWLRAALVLFAITIPFQLILFYGRVPKVPAGPNATMKWTHIVYWQIQYGSTRLIILGLGLVFSHFAWWLGLVFLLAAWVAYIIFRWWANSGEFPGP